MCSVLYEFYELAHFYVASIYYLQTGLHYCWFLYKDYELVHHVANLVLPLTI